MNEIISGILANVPSGLFLAAILHFMAKAIRTTNQVNLRLTDELREKFAQACAAVKEDASSVVRCCIEAFIEEVEARGEIRKPYAIVAKSRLRELEGPAPGEAEILCPAKGKLPTQQAPAGIVHMRATRGFSTPAPAGGDDEGLIAEKAGAYPASAKPPKKR